MLDSSRFWCYRFLFGWCLVNMKLQGLVMERNGNYRNQRMFPMWKNSASVYAMGRWRNPKERSKRRCKDMDDEESGWRFEKYSSILAMVFFSKSNLSERISRSPWHIYNLILGMSWMFEFIVIKNERLGMLMVLLTH